MASDEDDSGSDEARVLAFPYRARDHLRRRGDTPISEMGGWRADLGMRENQMTGHWCSHCRGIWFGYALEVECPRCGNRQG